MTGPARRGWRACVGFVLLCNGVGIASGVAGGDPAYYGQLARPSWAPPPVVFGPVWTALYTLMGVGAFLVWRRGAAARPALAVFAAQLALNAAWTPVFFRLRAPGAALVVIALVLAAVVAMSVAFARQVRLAGLLQVPLALWVGFATALNAALWWLNR